MCCVGGVARKLRVRQDISGSNPVGTTTEQAFDPGHLSRLPLGPGPKVAFVPGPTASRAGGDRDIWSRLEAPTRTKGHPFVPFGGSNRDKKGSFSPGWFLQLGQMSLAPSSPSPSPRPSHSAHLFLLFLARVRGVLAHLLTTFVKIFYSSVHPSALKVWCLFLSSFIACVAHFML